MDLRSVVLLQQHSFLDEDHAERSTDQQCTMPDITEHQREQERERHDGVRR